MIENMEDRLKALEIVREVKIELGNIRAELETLRVELEKNSKELEVYKKALELACEYLWENSICECCPELTEREKCGCDYCIITSNEIKSYMLKKAREE